MDRVYGSEAFDSPKGSSLVDLRFALSMAETLL